MISFTLDRNSIDNAIRELEAYKQDFISKCEQLRQRVAERIAWSAQRGFQTAMLGDTFMRISGKNRFPEQPIIGGNVTVTPEQRGEISVVIADGEDAVWIEFGAGVYHNGAAGDSPHPWALENGFGIGTFGQGKGARNVWGYKDGENGIVLTHGTPAAMPMYRGAEEAMRAMDEIVREVFG